MHAKNDGTNTFMMHSIVVFDVGLRKQKQKRQQQINISYLHHKGRKYKKEFVCEGMPRPV